jgi:hypothetical protein
LPTKKENLRVTYSGIGMYFIQLTGKPSEMGKSLQIRHKRESGNKKFARHFKSLGVKYDCT